MSEKFEIPEHGNGAILSGYSEKDYKMEDHLNFEYPISGVPNEFVYGPVTPIINQGSVSSCVAHAGRKMKEFMEKRERNKSEEWSNNFIYHNRSIDDHQGEGMVSRQMLDQLRKEGVCSYSLCKGNTPYYEDRNYLITSNMRKNAKDQKIKSYALVNSSNANEVSKALIENGVMMATIQTYPCFSSYYPYQFNLSKKDYVKFVKNERELGYHSVLVIGYRITPNGIEYKIQNSWGTEWGDSGCAWLSYDYPITELWAIIDEFLPPPTKDKKIIFKVDSPRYSINDTMYFMDTIPVKTNDRTFVPLRYLTTALSCSVEYIQQNDGTALVSVYDYKHGYFDFYVGTSMYKKKSTNQTITKSKEETIYIDKAGRTMVPLRMVAEALDFKVDWKEEDQSITITRSY